MNAHCPHLLVVKEGPSAGNSFPLEGVEILIGREPSSTILIDSPAVSRRLGISEHATGTPQAIASSGGNPNPSYLLGKTKARAPL